MLVMQVMDVQMFQVSGQFILDFTIFLCLAANEDGAKFKFRKSSDNLVDPTGNSAAHVGKRPFQQ